MLLVSTKKMDQNFGIIVMGVNDNQVNTKKNKIDRNTYHSSPFSLEKSLGTSVCVCWGPTNIRLS